MHLREIELENFKSFAKKTRIPLLQGYTSVTGPNGAGKSNISDAILFVLGPKSSRVIRAGRLSDLIFNGGKERKPASQCRVSLVFDNSDRLIPIDSDSVKLTRLVKLSENADGYYSYFYVNERKSSLGEFEELLANARISADGYNFVQQGDITRIVEMSNLERRRIVDDIAGITKFDSDIQSAEKERVTVEENVGRLSIILDEIRKQMRQLEKDREGALQYKDLHDRLVLAKAGLAVKHKESIEREIASLQEQISQYTSEKEKAEEKRRELQEQLTEVSLRLSEAEREIAERGGEEAREIKEKIDNLRIEVARAKDACSNSEEMIESLKETRQAQQEDLEAVEADLATLKEKLEPLRESKDEKGKALAELRNELEGHHDDFSKSDSELSSLQKGVTELTVTINAKEEKMHALTLEQDRLSERLSRIKLDIANLEETRKTLEFEHKDSEWSMKELRNQTKASSGEMKKVQDEFYTLRNREKKLLQQAQDLENAIKTLTREYNQLKAEAEAADMVKKGYNTATVSLLEARDRGGIKGIHGTVAELADVDDDYSTALNVAAGNRMQSIVVDTDQVASDCIDYLKKNKLGRATFLPLNKMIDGRPRGKALMASKESVGFAIDLISFDEKYRSAFWFVFGDTVVVKNLSEARRLMGGVRLVTLDGELAEASGAIVGGTLDKNFMKFGAPSESRIEKKSAELRAAIDQAESVQAELSEVKARVVELEDKIHESSTKDSGESAKISSLESRCKEFKQRIGALTTEVEGKNEEFSETMDLLDKVKEDLERFREEVGKVRADKEVKETKLLEATPHELSQKIKGLEKEILTLSDEFAHINSEVQTISKQIELVTGRKDELTENLATTDEKTEEHRKRSKESAKRQGELDTELKALLSMERSMGDQLNSLRTQRDKQYKLKTEVEAGIEKAVTKIQTSSDFVLSLRTKTAESEKRLEEAETELVQYSTVELPETLPSAEDMKATVGDCEREISGLGAVNLKAIDEYEERKSRHEELKEEVGRLNKQKANLVKLVEELNSKKRIGFEKIFTAISENFKKIFFELSGGGEADLLLENEEDPLAGGLIIRARPKDKKFVRMEALSGGEKSLTALSFIFAIQAFEPSPFYLLDEVDMFLDGVNAENVSRAVKRSSRNAQFIQISLRKVTLKESDHIIGVTMQREGISEVVMRPNIGETTELRPEEGQPAPAEEEAA
jgi:chromosome segregation protein